MNTTDALMRKPQEKQSVFLGLVFKPQTREQAWDLCVQLSKESWVAKCYVGNPTFVAIALSFGEKFGLEPLTALTSIAIINGKPMIYGDMPLALCRRSYPKLYYREEYFMDRIGCRVTVRRSPNDVEVVEEFDMVRAERMNLAGKQGPWQTTPERMCMWRARGYALRTAFPDVLMGFLTEHEAIDMVKDENGVWTMPGEGTSSSPEARPTELNTDAANREKAVADMKAAKTTDALKKAAALFSRSNPSAEKRDEVAEIYKSCLAKVKKGPAKSAPASKPEPTPDDAADAAPIIDPDGGSSNMHRAKSALADQMNAAFASAGQAD